MSGPTPVQVGSFTQDNSTLNINAASPFTVGNTVYIAISSFIGGYNSITVAGTAARLDNSFSPDGDIDTAQIWSVKIETAGTLISSSDSRYFVGAYIEVPGDWTVLDTVGTNSGVSNSATVTATSAMTSADEFVITNYANGSDDSGTTGIAGYTTAYSAGSTGGEGGAGGYKATSAITTLSATISLSNTISWAALIASYKQANVPGCAFDPIGIHYITA
jgi:hypothetical protein